MDRRPAIEQQEAAAVISTCTSLNLRKAARAASQFLEDYLQPLGLHAGQFGILSHLSKAGAISMTRLAEALTLDRTTLTRNLQILQRDGLVKITSGKDQRVRVIALTEKGHAVFAQAIPLWEQAEAALVARLGSDLHRSLLSSAAALIAMNEK